MISVSVKELLTRRSYTVAVAHGRMHAQSVEYLAAGRVVCFGGTPCKIEGLKRFLRKEQGKGIYG